MEALSSCGGGAGRPEGSGVPTCALAAHQDPRSPPFPAPLHRTAVHPKCVEVIGQRSLPGQEGVPGQQSALTLPWEPPAPAP